MAILKISVSVSPAFFTGWLWQVMILDQYKCKLLCFTWENDDICHEDINKSVGV